MSERPTVDLRVEPHAIPQLRAAYTAAVDELQTLLVRARNHVFINEPWLGDPISRAVQRTYNFRYVTGDGSAFNQLLAYHEELIKIRDALAEMEDAYRRTEGDNSALWGRLA